MSFGDILRELRKSHRLSTRELAEKLHLSHSTIGMYEQGRREPNYETLEAIADYFNVDMDYLLGRTNTRNRYNLANGTVTFNIPLYSSISCGTGIFIDDQIEDYIAVPDKYIKSNKEYFANTAKGDSMINKQIYNGDILVFERTNVLNNGDIGCFCVDNNTAVCKVYRELPNHIILLESANEKYEPIMVDVTSECFRIIGKLRFKFSIID